MLDNLHRFLTLSAACILGVTFSYAVKAAAVGQLNEEPICTVSSWYSQHKNFHVEKVDVEPAVFEKIAPWYAPDGKSFMKIMQPDTMKEPPWALKIFIPRSAQPSLLITVEDGEGEAYWKTQDNIVVDFWWGRIAETQFDIYVKTGRFYVTDINHGDALMPFEEACPDSLNKKTAK